MYLTINDLKNAICRDKVKMKHYPILSQYSGAVNLKWNGIELGPCISHGGSRMTGIPKFKLL